MKAKHLLTYLLAGALLVFSPNLQAQTSGFHANQRLHFVRNKGQVKDQYGHPRTDIDYRLEINKDFNLFIGKGLLQYQWIQPAKDKGKEGGFTTQHLDVQLIGANKKAEVISENKVEYYEQYYLQGVATKADAYQQIIYKDIYPHIDWMVYLKNNVAEYDFVVHPSGNVADIKIRYNGASNLTINRDGSLTANTPAGVITESAPISTADGKKVASQFTLQNDIVGFKTAPYSGTLTIDPAIIWGTYLGGSLSDVVNSVTCDRRGNIYTAGSTASTANIATTGAYQGTYGGGTGGNSYVGDAYLAKFNTSGTPLWITYYGGTAADQGWGVAADTSYNVYLSGFTSSTASISTAGAQQATLGGSSDAFLVKFDSTGTRQWATYFGGTGAENKQPGVCTDRSGNVFLTGITASTTGIATAGSHQSTYGGSTDAFLAKYNSAGVLQWSTYYGGTGADNDYANCTTDRWGNVYLSGLTNSTNGIATAGSQQATYGGASDGYLVKFNAAGVRQWATYYGGANYDRIHAMAATDSGYIYTLGTSLSTTGITTTGAFQTAPAGTADNAMLVKWDTAGNRQWATYYGGGGTGVANPSGQSSLAIGSTGAVYFCGTTNAASGISTTGALVDTLTGSYDAFVARFNGSGQRVWATYYGGPDGESSSQVATDGSGNVFLSGSSNSGSGIATSGGYHASNSGGYLDGFLVKINDCDSAGTPGAITGPAVVCKGSTNTYSIPAIAGATAYQWTAPNGWTGTSTTNTITLTAGRDTGTLKVVAIMPCNNSRPQTLFISQSVVATISPNTTSSLCTGDSITLRGRNNNGIIGGGSGGIGSTTYTYQWIKDGSTVAGATDSLFRAGASGRYAVVITANSSGPGGSSCADTSAADTVIVHPLPVPVITVQNGVLSTAGTYSTYQWFFNGTAITGALSQSFTPVVNGGYTVTVTDANGCTGTSAVYPVTGLTVTNVNTIAIPVRLYPNPVKDLLLVDSPVPVDLQIRAIDGRIVAASEQTQTINTNSLADGIYIVQIRDVNGLLLKTEKVIKRSH